MTTAMSITGTMTEFSGSYQKLGLI